MSERLARWIVNHPLLIVLCSIIIVGLFSTGLSNITLNANYRVYFSDDNPHLKNFEVMQAAYERDDNVLIVVSPKEGDVFNNNTLSLVQEITEKSWTLPYSSRVDSITNFQYTHSADDELIVEELVTDPGDLTDIQRNQIKNIALNEPLLSGALLSLDGRMTGVNVKLIYPGLKPAREIPELVDTVRNMVSEFKVKYPDHQFYLAGVSMLNNAFPEASNEDAKTLYPVMLIFIIILLFIVLRGFWGMFSTMLVVIFSSVVAMGFIGWVESELAPTILKAPVMIMTLAIADCVHILMSYYQGLAKDLDKKEAMIESIRINIQPIFLTSLTTIIGFLSLNFSDSPPFQDLGNIVAFGVLFAFIFALLFMPAVMMFLPAKKMGDQVRNKNAMENLSNFVIRNQTVLLGLTSAFIIVMILLIPGNRLDDNSIEYFDERVQFRTDVEKINADMTGVMSLYFDLPSGYEGGVTNPEYLKNIDKFSQWLKTQDVVRHVVVFSDIMKRLNRNMHDDNDAFYKLPESSELSSQYLLLYELSLPYGLGLNNLINEDKSSTRLSISLTKVSTADLLLINEHIVSWMEKNLPLEMVAEGASSNIMFAHITESNVKGMLGGLLSSLFVISLVLMAALRSVKLGALALLPNIVPGVLAFGIWSLIDGKVGLGLSVVMGMTLGIVVDDTVHFLSKYLRARREMKLSSEDAVRYAFNTVGVALIATTIVLCVGFFVLSLSTFKLNADMGLMSAITIGVALLIDFLFLPALLLKLEKVTHD
jgi:predicted RND superfamily exporter protein